MTILPTVPAKNVHRDTYKTTLAPPYFRTLFAVQGVHNGEMQLYIELLDNYVRYLLVSHGFPVLALSLQSGQF